MMQAQMRSQGFGSRVPEVYHMARCASDTFTVSKTFAKVAMPEAICIYIGQAPFVCNIKVSIEEKL